MECGCMCWKSTGFLGGGSPPFSLFCLLFLFLFPKLGPLTRCHACFPIRLLNCVWAVKERIFWYELWIACLGSEQWTVRPLMSWLGDCAYAAGHVCNCLPGLNGTFCGGWQFQCHGMDYQKMKWIAFLSSLITIIHWGLCRKMNTRGT